MLVADMDRVVLACLGRVRRVADDAQVGLWEAAW